MLAFGRAAQTSLILHVAANHAYLSTVWKPFTVYFEGIRIAWLARPLFITFLNFKKNFCVTLIEKSAASFIANCIGHLQP